MAVRKKRPMPSHLCFRQPEKIAHRHPRQFGSLNHAAEVTSSKSIMGRWCRVEPLPKRSLPPKSWKKTSKLALMTRGFALSVIPLDQINLLHP